MASRRELRERGEAMRRRLFGDVAGAEPLPGFSDLTAETTYGATWSRPGLAIADRMVCTLAALCAVRDLAQLRRYVPAALNVGLPTEAPFEIFLQIGIYAGFGASEAAATKPPRCTASVARRCQGLAPATIQWKRSSSVAGS